ncbi:MAG: hypothetical protein ACTH1D_09950 [Mycobacteriaceae bacterium]|uniref:hypothetical protein n=1 Tax=Corynebacterium sp. TaxID=1720 RepID=UPI003F946C37
MASSDSINMTPETPRQVRAGSAVLIGAGVGALATPLPVGFRVIMLVVFVGAGLLWIFSHPYRRDVRAAVEARGDRYTTRIKQVIPLFPIWLALMLVPAFQFDHWAIAVIAWAVAGVYTWQVVPRMDGTRELEEIARAEARQTGRDN